MPITETQRELRKKHLGSSDAPAILGLSRFRNAADVYWSKRADADTEDVESLAMRTGNRLERALLTFASEETGVRFRSNQFRVSRGEDGGVLAANLDGLAENRSEAVECKYVGAQWADLWGPEGSDHVPDDVQVQCQHQMYVAQLERVWVAVAMAGYSLQWRLYCVQRHEDLIKQIVERELEFWNQHIVPGIPPAGGELPSMDVLRALRREPGRIVTLNEQALKAWESLEEARVKVRLAEQERDARQREVLTLLGDAEIGQLPDGRRITYLEQRATPRVDLKRLRADHPDLYEQIVTENTCRVLRCVKNKERS